MNTHLRFSPTALAQQQGKSTTPTTREAKVCAFLKEIYEKTKNGPVLATELKIRELVKKHGLAHTYCTTLSKSGIIKSTKGHHGVTEWISREPNLGMAKRVIEKFTELNKYYGSSADRKKQAEQKVQAEQAIEAALKQEHEELKVKESKAINVLKETGKTFAEVSSLLELPESQVRNSFYDYILNS